MNKSIASRAGVIVLALMLGACATQSHVVEDSGFLRDYSNLRETKDAQGRTIRAWVSPKLTPANYDAILLDPLVFYPEPKPTEQVSAETLQQILAYLNDALKRSLSERFRVVDRAGPRVLRIRSAVTGVAAEDEGLKPYQYVPIALVATMASRSASGTPQRAFMEGEEEGTDSVTGELLALRVRMATGERLSQIGDRKVVTFDTLKPVLDEVAAGAFPDLARYVKPK